MILLSLLCLASTAFGQKKVAILPVVDKYDAYKGPDGYGKKLVLRTYLQSAIDNTEGYMAIDRVDYGKALDEAAFQRTGMVNDEEIKKVGEFYGANFVLVAEMAKYDDNQIILIAKLLNVENSSTKTATPKITSLESGALSTTCATLAQELLKIDKGGNSHSQISTATTSGSDFTENTFGINMKMKYVQGGSFMMGCTSEQGGDCDSDEKTLRRVTVSDYYIGVFEVTQGQWEKVMGTSVTQQRNKKDPSSSLRGTGSDYPMYYVSWEEAMAFCRELSRQTGKTYTLPTEAQWEYAARGGSQPDGSKYSGSYSVDAVAWYDGNSNSSTHPVGTKRPNALGLYDMSGNVWEWCLDWYGDYRDYDTENPTGASSGSYRVLRGGSWYDVARSCRISNRNYNSPGNRYNHNGFRVVLVP